MGLHARDHIVAIWRVKRITSRFDRALVNECTGCAPWPPFLTDRFFVRIIRAAKRGATERSPYIHSPARGRIGE